MRYVRRDLPLKVGLLLFVCLGAAPRRDDSDVIVVGAGIAGLSAAFEAASHHASVIVVDTSSVFGGHAVMSGGHVAIVDTPMQRARGIHDSPSLAAKDFATWGEDADRAWVDVYTKTSRHEIYDWLTSLGVTFDDVVHYRANSVPRQHATHDSGYGLVAPIYRECLRRGVQFRFLTKVNKLTRSGVMATDLRTGNTIELRAPAVILATGGFQSNLELVRANWPKSLPKPSRLLAGSGINSTGSGLELARAAGAKIVRLDHQWNYESGLPDPRYPDGTRGRSGSLRS